MSSIALPIAPPFTAPSIHAESLYGSDGSGLIWGYYFVRGQPAQLVDSSAVVALLTRVDHASTDAFLWLHYSLANAGCERWLHEHLSLPEAFYESLHERTSATRLEQEDDTLVAVIHDVMFDFTFDASAVSTVNLSVGPRLLVSARLRPLRSLDRLRAAVKAGRTFRSSSELLAHLLHDQALVLADIIRQSTIRVDGIEDKLLSNRISLSRSELSSLRRVLVRLQRLLAPEPAALFRLLSRPPKWLTGDDLQDLREAAEEFSAAIVDSAALVERIRLLQEELAAQINEQTNRSVFTLTIVTVLALPINIVAGLFGMNVEGIPFSGHPQAFFLIVAILAAMTALFIYLAFRRHSE